MRKLLFFVLGIVTMTGFAHGANITIRCQEFGDTNCTVDSKPAKISNSSDCNKIPKTFDKDTVLYIGQDGNGKMICGNAVNRATSNSSRTCPQIRMFYQDNLESYFIFCTTNKNIQIIYNDTDIKKLSYAQKQCIGSGGKWSNGACECDALTGTKQIGNECLCTNKLQKYYNPVLSGCETLRNGVQLVRFATATGFGVSADLATYDRANSCDVTGGNYEGQFGDSRKSNTCNCNRVPNMHLDGTGYFCECNDGYDYEDPTNKHKGCKPISEIPDHPDNNQRNNNKNHVETIATDETNSAVTISGTIRDKDDTLPMATISWEGNQGTTTDTDGHFNITVPGNTLLTFSYVGYEKIQKTASELAKMDNVEIILSADNTLDEVTIVGEAYTPQANDQPIDNVQQKNDETTTTKEPNTQAVAEKLKQATDAYQAAKDKEQSLANRAVTAASTAATGLGAMQMASALSEQRIDAEAETAMREYLATMHCEYGRGQQVKLGMEETLPGGNELLNYYSEYKALADSLKATKAALGLRSGIESETLYDKAESGLYQYSSIGKQSSGGEDMFSLARALTDADSADAAAFAAQKEQSAQKLTVGGITAGAGLVTGIAGNLIINREKNTELKKEFDTITTDLINQHPQTLAKQSGHTPAENTNPDTNALVRRPTSEPIEIPTRNNPAPAELDLQNISLTETAFDKSEFDLNDSGKKTLNDLIQKITNTLNNDKFKNYSISIQTTGHTDKRQITQNTKKAKGYSTNYELSEKRAKSVLEYLKEGLTSFGRRVRFGPYIGQGAEWCEQNNRPADSADCRRVDIKIQNITI